MGYSVGTTVVVAPVAHSRDFRSFDRLEDDYIKNNILPKMGVITSMYKSEDRSYHGSPSYETIYSITLQDGRVVKTDSELSTYVAIKTPQEFIASIQKRLVKNNSKIRELTIENNLIQCRLSEHGAL